MPPPPGSAAIILEGQGGKSGAGGEGEKVREVYMGGRWVKVTGEGPVVYPGKEFFKHKRGKHDDEEQGPSGPLSVIP
jgi:hypothetical protein